MHLSGARGARSVIAVLGLGLLTVGGWQVLDHGGGRHTVLPSQGASVGATGPAGSSTPPSARGSTGSTGPTGSSMGGRTSRPTAGSTSGVQAGGSPATSDTGTRPDHIAIDAIGVDAVVHPQPTRLAYDPWLKRRVSQFGVPGDTSSVAWWSGGPTVGAGPGLAVLLGHTTVGGAGVFNRLGQLRPGDAVVLRGAPTTRNLAVLAVTSDVSKTDSAALQRTLQRPPAGAIAALITCSGDVNPSGTSHADNTVVFLR